MCFYVCVCVCLCLCVSVCVWVCVWVCACACWLSVWTPYLSAQGVVLAACWYQLFVLAHWLRPFGMSRVEKVWLSSGYQHMVWPNGLPRVTRISLAQLNWRGSRTSLASYAFATIEEKEGGFKRGEKGGELKGNKGRNQEEKRKGNNCCDAQVLDYPHFFTWIPVEYQNLLSFNIRIFILKQGPWI